MRILQNSLCIIYCNNFIENVDDVVLSDSINQWNRPGGYYHPGNFWDSHEKWDNDGDNISDIPVYVDENNVDYFPLMDLYYQPIADFTFSPTNPDVDEETQFTASDPNGIFVYYHWNFGDGSVSHWNWGLGEPIVHHSYSESGTYEVTLTISGFSMSSTSQYVTVLEEGNPGDPGTEEPTADFTYFPSNPVEEEEIIFASTSDGDIVSYEWDFGIAFAYDGPEQPFYYSSAGTYQVTLTVTDQNGITDSTSQTVIIRRKPVLLVHGIQLLQFDLVNVVWNETAEFLSGNTIDNIKNFGNFWKLEAKNNDFRNVYISNYADCAAPTLRNLIYYASILSSEIEDITEEEDITQIDVVAHSMGGLVTRAYIESEDLENLYGLEYRYDIRKLIMLGTPNHGGILP